MPTRNFGPWTTSLDSGSHLELSAFWRRRLTSLRLLRIDRPRRSVLSAGLLVCVAATGLIPRLSFEQEGAVAALFAAEDAADESALPPEETARRERSILASLSQPMEVNFSEFALNDVTQYLADYHRIPIRLDKPALDEQKIDPTTLLVTIRFKGASLASTLELIFGPLHLDWMIERGELVITSPERARAHQSARAFDVSEIVRLGFDTGELARTVTRMIEPASWQAAGGPGTLALDGDSLLVRHNLAVLKQVESLLNELRLAQYGFPRLLQGALPGEASYEVGDLRGKGAVDDLLGFMLDQSIAEPIRQVEESYAEGRLREDRFFVRGQSLWGRAAAVGFLSSLRQGRRADPNAPLTSAQLTAAGADIRTEVRRRKAAVLLERYSQVHFADVTLEDALFGASQTIGIELVNGARIKSVDAAKSLEVPPRRVTIAPVNRLPHRMLDDILLPLDLDWRLAEDVIVVMPAEPAKQRRELCVYRLAELAAVGRSEAGLVERLVKRSAIRWSNARLWNVDDPESGRLHIVGGYLFVSHNPRMQRYMERLLPDRDDGR